MKEKEKNPIAIYIFLFVLILTIISWNTVGWMFNYRVMYQLTYDFFYHYPDSPYLVSASEIRINQTPPQQIAQVPVQAIAPEPKPVVQPVKVASYQKTDKTNSLEIPALGLQTAL